MTGSIHFHQLINTLSKEQYQYSFPHQKSKSVNDHNLLNHVFDLLKYDDKENEFELVPSFSRDNSIIIATINLFFPCAIHQIDEYLSYFYNFIQQWIIVNKEEIKRVELDNKTRLNYYLNSKIDHDDQFILISLIFQVNIIVINLEGRYRLFSTNSLTNLYVIYFQHSNTKYSAVKFKPVNSQAICNLIDSISVIEISHPIISKLFDYLN